MVATCSPKADTRDRRLATTAANDSGMARCSRGVTTISSATKPTTASVGPADLQSAWATTVHARETGFADPPGRIRPLRPEPAAEDDHRDTAREALDDRPGMKVTARPETGDAHGQHDDPRQHGHHATLPIPCSATIGASTTAMAPVGPDTCTWEPPNTRGRKPATTAVIQSGSGSDARADAGTRAPVAMPPRPPWHRRGCPAAPGPRQQHIAAARWQPGQRVPPGAGHCPTGVATGTLRTAAVGPQACQPEPSCDHQRFRDRWVRELVVNGVADTFGPLTTRCPSAVRCWDNSVGSIPVSSRISLTAGTATVGRESRARECAQGWASALKRLALIS